MTIRVAGPYLVDDTTGYIVGIIQYDGTPHYLPFVTVQPASYAASIAAGANLSAADKFIYGGVEGASTEGDISAVGRAMIAAADAAAQRTTLELFTACKVLFTLAANMNVTDDQPFTKVGTFTSYDIVQIRCKDPSLSLTTAVGGIYNAALKGGDALVANTQINSNASSATTAQAYGITPAGFATQTATPILSLTTPQGAAATANLVIYGCPRS